MRKLRKTGAVDPDVKVVTIPRLPSVTGVHKPPGRNRRSAAEKVEHLLGMSSTACTTTFLGLPTASTRAGLRQQVSLRIRSQLPTSGVPKLTNRPSAIAKWITHLEQILLRRQQQPRPGGDDLEQITRARQAAEALFRSKPPVSGPSVPASAPADQSARKPRVLQIISPAVPVRRQRVAVVVDFLAQQAGQRCNLFVGQITGP
jgi:hypothetical protein